jgi:hypothetical protein
MALLFMGCESESYETGDGSLSYLTECFGMLHTIEAQTADYVVTDSGTKVVFDNPAAVSWAETADSLYRVQAYYKAKDNSVEPIALNQVGVAQLYDANKLNSIPTDPLTFISAWRGGGYLNVAFQVKTGKQEGEVEAQIIGFVRDSVRLVDNKVVSYVRMLHAQNNQPQYYSVRSYASIAWPADCDRMVLTVNDYDGIKSKTVE